jgi:hypothetical protein
VKTGDVYGGNYLSAEDLNGREVTVRIESVSTMTDNDSQKKKLVLHFQGKVKTLVLNVTNANSCQELLGSDETDDWIGRKICLFPTKVNFQGKMVPAIRVKEAAAAKAKPKPLPEPDPDEVEDNTPFDDDARTFD